MGNKIDFMNYATSRLNKKKIETEKGRKAAIYHLLENSRRIQSKLRGERKLVHKEW
ncbi:hypothetical protein [Clostridium tunisiense]|uniref:hypothetical protein n=1 Tax=Clostridium tunisiense TaxID=219748 RepID=UPI0002F51F0B|nr:hypothetical protein [Clostridium tunisiense]